MSFKQVGDSSYIVGRLQRVKIVGPLSEINSRGSQLLKTFPVAHAGTPPVVALEKHERPIKTKTSNRHKARAAPESVSHSQHGELPLRYCTAGSWREYHPEHLLYFRAKTL